MKKQASRLFRPALYIIAAAILGAALPGCNSSTTEVNRHALYRVFNQMYTLNAAPFPSIRPFPGKEGRYVILNFFHPTFRKYNAKEIGIFDKDSCSYHRLPGALPDGEGYVAPGDIYIGIHSMSEPEVSYVLVRKLPNDSMALVSIGPDSLSGVAYNRLETRYYNYRVEIVRHALNWLNWHKGRVSGLDADYRQRLYALADSASTLGTEFAEASEALKHNTK